MAQIDPSIAMSYRGFTLPDPVNRFAQLQQIQSAQQANALNQMQMDEALRRNANENALARFVESSDMALPENRAALVSKFGKPGIERVTALNALDREQRAADTEFDRAVLARQALSRELLREVRTPEEYIAWHEQNHRDPILSKYFAQRGVTADKARAGIMKALETPEGFQEQLRRSALGLDTLMNREAKRYVVGNSLVDESGKVLVTAPPKDAAGPAGVQEYEYAKANGYKGSFIDWIREKRPPPQAPAPGPLEKVVGPGGKPVLMTREQAEGKTPWTKGSDLRPIPAHVNKAIIGNSSMIKKVEDALTLIGGSAIGAGKTAVQGDRAATGWKGYLPESILQRVDPSGVSTRAAIADLGSMEIHTRSGAAVTASEFPRLAPFIPLSTDTPETIKKKLRGFERVLKEEQAALTETYSESQGYVPSPVLTGGKTPAAPKAGAAPPPGFTVDK